ncbi:hypothetical protein AVEN_40209-1 [Araneus ventricosus]|uniref:Uncharacterized protein n=1 Tax=Araneus ventricosus TaxID=182803 RepID=A0A4Y1ZLX7_ARAVE|nr:hypothetical protein AVEN_40209-1 [Araneus ventricosus]
MEHNYLSLCLCNACYAQHLGKILSIRMASQISRSETFQLLPVEILEVNIYRNKLPTLIGAIRQHVSAIPQEILLNAVDGVLPRLTAVLLNDRHHIGQL